jgi:hypothetical protein
MTISITSFSARTGTVTLNTNLVLRGNLTFESGILNSNAKNISLNGNWENPLGQAAFTESTGKVTFAGSSGHQYCNYSETFNILEVNKASGALRINSASAHVVCAQYDWTAGALDVLTGTFTANELVDNGIYGSLLREPQRYHQPHEDKRLDRPQRIANFHQWRHHQRYRSRHHIRLVIQWQCFHHHERRHPGLQKWRYKYL